MNQQEITDAVVLLAGAGSRLSTARGPLPKPLVPVHGRPLIAYVLHALATVGVRTIHAVVGANADDVVRGAMECLPDGLRLNRIDNPHWQMQNGVSVLCAASAIDRPFFLTMGDHLFEARILHRLLDIAAREHLSLAVDRKIDGVFDLDDATKVRTEGRAITAIGKDLSEFDAIDTGVFLCSPLVFTYFERAKVQGDCSLSSGVELMAREHKADAIDIGGAWWQDVDTPAMLARAEQQLPDSLRVIPDAPLIGG